MTRNWLPCSGLSGRFVCFSPFRRALLSLSHPISIAAILTLLLNDQVFRRVSPSWLTGKLGDFAWLIFAPFLLAALLAWLPRRIVRDEETVGRVAITGTGLIFALAKTWPAFHALTIDVLEALTGWPNVLRRDPADLLALPALLIAWRIWQHSRLRASALPQRGWVLLPLAVMVTMANSPAPYPIGVRQIDDIDSILYTPDFHSDDGGLTWQEGGRTELQSYGHDQTWQVVDPTDDRVQYRFTPGVAIERSADGGQTWQREFDLSGEEARVASISVGWNMQLGPFDADFHRPTGNLVVAMGLEGVLVRSPQGEWRWISVGSFSMPRLDRLDRIAALLSGEIWLGVALIALTLSTLARHVNTARITEVLTAIGLLVVLPAAWYVWREMPLNTRPNTSDAFGLAAIVLTLLSMFRKPGWRRALLIAAWGLWGVLGLVALTRESGGAGAFKFVLCAALAGVSVVTYRRVGQSNARRMIASLLLAVLLAALCAGWAIMGWGFLSILAGARFPSSDLAVVAVLTGLSLGVAWLAHRPGLKDALPVAALTVAWIGWGSAPALATPAIPSGGIPNLTILYVPAVVILALVVSLWQGRSLYRQSRRVLMPVLIVALIGALLYCLPFALWTQGVIPHYSTATLYALALTAATLLAGFSYLRRHLDTATSPASADDSGGVA